MFRGLGIIILVVLCAGLFSPVMACPDRVYIGLYVDGLHSDCDEYVTAYKPFTLWVWVLPSMQGVTCLEFRLEKPEWLELLGMTEHILAADLEEDFDWFGEGGKMCYEYCRFQWTWVFQFTLMPTDASATGFITMHEWARSGNLLSTTCKEDYPIQALIPITYLAINQSCEIGTENATWGAIKGLYKDQ
ncbi:MAG: hypothetical protein KAV42_11855 [Candidatus Krumholzibacteria bacterium]|nr:hypothetical protein [Candidatus Krumholzibacteria bacterium]